VDAGGLEPCFKQEPGPAGEMGNLSGAVSRPIVHIGNIRYEPMIYAVGVSIISLSVGYCRFAADGPVARRYRSTAAVAAGECGQCSVVSVRGCTHISQKTFLETCLKKKI